MKDKRTNAGLERAACFPQSPSTFSDICIKQGGVADISDCRRQRLSWNYGRRKGGEKNGRFSNCIPKTRKKGKIKNLCQISIPAGSPDSVGGIGKPTIKHMGIKIIVSSVGGHDGRQMDGNQRAPPRHPGRSFCILPA